MNEQPSLSAQVKYLEAQLDKAAARLYDLADRHQPREQEFPDGTTRTYCKSCYIGWNDWPCVPALLADMPNLGPVRRTNFPERNHQ